ncbi:MULTISPECIES: hypothetical protein [unclassified Streptomyces]|uniref:hypothetical protein n=1 Tax=unclassified Streptomyces TaxID=2593676 RepID=UPI0033CCFEF7
MSPETRAETHTATRPDTRAEWAARNAAYAATHPVPRPARNLALGLATPAVLLPLALAWWIVGLDAELGEASSAAHQDLVFHCVLGTFGGVGCLAAGWLTPRDADAAWLRTAFALTSVVAMPAVLFAG